MQIRAIPLTNTDSLPLRPRKALQEAPAATTTAVPRDIRAARGNRHAAPTIKTATIVTLAGAAHTIAAVHTDHRATPPVADPAEQAEEDKTGNNENTKNIFYSHPGTPHPIHGAQSVDIRRIEVLQQRL